MSQSARDPTVAPVLTDTVWFVEVVRDAQAGNLSAFDTLFQYYNARICTYLARMIDNDEEGRDLAQETFIKVWRALPGMNGVPQFETWLYRIATNTAIDHLRRRKFRWPLSNPRAAGFCLWERAGQRAALLHGHARIARRPGRHRSSAPS